MSSLLDKGLIPLGSIRGIPVRLSAWFLVLLVCIVVWAGVFGNAPVAVHNLLLFGPILLFTVLVHELGHCFAARSVGGEAHGILLWPLGGLAYVGHNTGPRADIWVAVAGPLTHIPMTLLWLAIYVAVFFARYGNPHINLKMGYATWQNLGINICVAAIVMNLVLLAFNLLVPAYPLDGGRILADSLLLCGMSEVVAAKVVVGVALPISVAIVIVGVFSFSSFSSILTIMVGVWILVSTIMLLQAINRGLVKFHPLFAFNPDQTMPPNMAAQQMYQQQQQHLSAPYPPPPPPYSNPYPAPYCVEGRPVAMATPVATPVGYPSSRGQMVCALFMLAQPKLEDVFPEAAARANKQHR